MPDRRELVDQARAGDAGAFCELCRTHSGALLRQASALCGDSVLAEDLVQETLVEAWKSIGRYHGRCRLFTWLCSILLHRYRNHFRKKRAISFSFLFREQKEKAETRLSQVPDPGILPSEAVELDERAQRLVRSLERLPRKQREAIHLRFYAQDSLEGIATALGCSVGTVKSRLFKGLERLRKIKSLEED